MNANPSNAAFPSGTHGTHLGGLTKRELFAAMAMQGLLAPGTISFAHMRAAAAVELADALLAELAKESAQGGKSDG